MSNKISASDDYVNFRQSVPRKSAQIQGMTWKYYSVMESRSARELKAAPREVLVLLHSTSGTAESFFYQLLNLGCKGYPILACNIPAYKSPLAFARGLKAFLASLGFSRVHLCGVSLGGYLALQVAAYFPDLVSSLVLTNSFCDTLPFQRAGASCLGIMDYMPDFYVKGLVLNAFPKHTPYPAAVDFVVDLFESSLSRKEVAARIRLNCVKSTLGNVALDQTRITILECADEVSTPEILTEGLHARFPDARVAQIKEGGDFPMLSVPGDVCLHLQIHLRNMGVKPEEPSKRAQPSEGGEGGQADEEEERLVDASNAAPQEMKSMKSSRSSSKKKKTHFLAPSASTRRNFTPSTYEDQSRADVVRGAEENLLNKVTDAEADAQNLRVREEVERERNAKAEREAEELEKRQVLQQGEDEAKKKQSALISTLTENAPTEDSPFN